MDDIQLIPLIVGLFLTLLIIVERQSTVLSELPKGQPRILKFGFSESD